MFYQYTIIINYFFVIYNLTDFSKKMLIIKNVHEIKKHILIFQLLKDLFFINLKLFIIINYTIYINVAACALLALISARLFLTLVLS